MEPSFDLNDLIDPKRKRLIDAVFRLNQLAVMSLAGWEALEQVQGSLSELQARQRDIARELHALVLSMADHLEALPEAELGEGIAELGSYVDARRLTVAKDSIADDALKMADLFMTTWGIAPR